MYSSVRVRVILFYCYCFEIMCGGEYPMFNSCLLVIQIIFGIDRIDDLG